ncbi:Fur family transcriptional regulator [Acidocella aminolytica]|uniref:Ferric uptake regulation protein n=1 Tax=Acidocella aminolytica 101 = DSM 11237 TaxID=1120923 RepID=A0A0D6PLR2_9PROT|nr:transcriptional repressor [Acidocella aminolytica]GAN82163.1 transcriptional regulator ferric uptake Fur [Acidocella aminolytica 101 = DSM 11237]GBQ43257.1 Fur family transcriptional regulator [Acidocella aminolytica 101 = DSM 11237]SHF55837.1 Fur family transcriptional regulator, zinc uptake regulator [Acidocella aminolytica 101 = DSM 11237]
MPHDAASHHDISARLQAAAQACAQNGTQLTALRREVLELILQAQTPVTAYQLLDQLKPIRKSAVPPTIYRSLEFLLENKLIHKIERLNAFVPCAEADHHHADAQFLICKNCGAVIEIEDYGVSEALAQAAAKHGFTPSRAVVEVDGLCAACAAKPAKQA